VKLIGEKEKLTERFKRGFSGLDGEREARIRWMKGREPVVDALCLRPSSKKGGGFSWNKRGKGRRRETDKGSWFALSRELMSAPLVIRSRPT